MTFVALAGWLNVLTFRMPQGVAMLLLGIAGTLALYGMQLAWPRFTLLHQIESMVTGIDFVTAVLGYMLAFLLFAGAMQVDLEQMRKHWFSIGALATLGVAGSILIVGVGTWLIARALGLPLSLPWALVFGALISPTDREAWQIIPNAADRAARRGVVQRWRGDCCLYGAADRRERRWRRQSCFVGPRRFYPGIGRACTGHGGWRGRHPSHALHR
jgi:hypothetical protein